jgi:hypothetical protein
MNRTDLWLPLGPGVMLRENSDGNPRVTGRIWGLAVSDDGKRIYAASGQGGLWYSGDAGLSWLPLFGPTVVSDRTTLPPSSNVSACGAVHVRFDPGGDPLGDEVWVGTGEPVTLGVPLDFGVINFATGGAGILRASGPVPATIASPGTDFWHHEAQPTTIDSGLLGEGIFRLAEDPGTPRRLVAATTAGLHTFDPTVIGGEPWSLVTVAAWEGPLGGDPGSAHVMVTDVAWVATPAGPRLWVAVAGAGPQNIRVKGLWRSDDGVTGEFHQVQLPGMTTAPDLRQLNNLGLAAAPSDGTVLYVLGNGPRLWRVDGDTQVRRVTGLPTELFGDTDEDQSYYDLAVAVDPRQPLRLIVGGSTVNSPITPDSDGAALYRLTLQTPVPTGTGPWHTDYVGHNGQDGTWVGAGVHADVHTVRWLAPPAQGGAGTVVVGSDGGVFVSAADGDRTTFVALNDGLAVAQAGFIDSHPANDAIVLAGLQDNGTQLRIGDSVWRKVLHHGDGGGVAFDPANPHRFLGQGTHVEWEDDGGNRLDPPERGPASALVWLGENHNSLVFNNPAVLRTLTGRTQLAIGTTRVWYSERWSRNWDSPATVNQPRWVTLPTGTDPLAGGASDATTDRLPPGPLPPNPGLGSGIRALRWADENRIYAVLPGAVYRLERDANTRRWTPRPTTILTRVAASGDPAPAVPGRTMPPHGALNDLVVHNPDEGRLGSFYLATSHPLEPVWFFDGDATWFPSTLGSSPDGVRAPAYSLASDPDNRSTVFAGTAVGVWKGVLTLTGAGVRSWSWTPFSNGLPEAAVQDLQIVTYPLPQGGHARLLRAALQARGVWEVDLDAPVADLTYLRVHPYDTRRAIPVPLADPLHSPDGGDDRVWHLDWSDTRARDFKDIVGNPVPSPDGTQPGEFSWHASPDVRVRPAPGAPVLPVAGLALPWTSRPADQSALWALQTALHGLDPLTVPEARFVVPDGQWTALFALRLAAIRGRLGLIDVPRADETLWKHPQVQAAFWATPWERDAPTEADLIERLMALPTPRSLGPMFKAESPASCALPAGPASVEVCIHRRAMLDAEPTDVSVLLLRTALPADPANWAALPALTVPGLAAAMDVAPGGGPLPASVTLPTGWTVADTRPELAIRRPPIMVGTGRPAVVSFAIDLTGQLRGARWLLLALLHDGPLSPSLDGAAGLRDQILRSPHVAARSFQVL